VSLRLIESTSTGAGMVIASYEPASDVIGSD
jgi:hypothetical protein